jgi:flagellar hook-associated protein 3 FlgL
MALRITQNAIFQGSVQALQRGFEQGARIREQIGTGKRVNRASDDPASFLRILPLRRDLATLGIDSENASIVLDSMNSSTSALEETLALISRARETAMHGANGTTSADERRTAASFIDEVLQSTLAAANTQFGDRYLFGGSRTDQPAFVLRTDNGWTRVEYLGDGQRVEVEVAPGVDTSVNVPGDEIFLGRRRAGTTLTGTTGVAAGSGTDSGVGFDTLTISHTGYAGLPAGIAAGSTPATALGNLAFSITAGLPATISVGGGPAVSFTAADTNLQVTTAAGTRVFLDMSAYTPAPASGTFTSNGRATLDGGQSFVALDFAASNQVVRDSVTGKVLNIDARGVTTTGDSTVRFAGTFDVFTALIALRDALRNDAGAPAETVRERIGSLLGELDFARDSVLTGLQELGGRAERVTLIKNRVEAIQLGARSSISREEEIDLAEAVTRLSQADLSYQAALNMGARVLQVSLLNYL